MTRLVIGEGRKRYSMPDPDALREAYCRASLDLRNTAGEVDQDDLRKVLILAEGYLMLTTYRLGQECCVGKLRDVWRARRARKKVEVER